MHTAGPRRIDLEARGDRSDRLEQNLEFELANRPAVPAIGHVVRFICWTFTLG